MIRPLRAGHRAVFTGLALALPALLGSAWWLRHDPVRQGLPPEYLPSPAIERLEAYAYDLVYWTATEDLYRATRAAGSEELPEDAELVGSVRGGALESKPPRGKRRLVYSLAHDRIRDTSRDVFEPQGNR